MVKFKRKKQGKQLKRLTLGEAALMTKEQLNER